MTLSQSDLMKNVTRIACKFPKLTPASEGYYMPAEWYPHDKCWIHWPHRLDNWRMKAVPARAAFKNVITAISQFEPVYVCVSAICMENAKFELEHLPNVFLVPIESDDSWMRDTGPTFVIKHEHINTNNNDNNTVFRNNISNTNTSKAITTSTTTSIKGVDWKFNFWGNKGFDVITDINNYNNDIEVAYNICKYENIECYHTRNIYTNANNTINTNNTTNTNVNDTEEFVLEGGSIHVDGEGTCITTEECLLHTNRNPTLTKSQIEVYLQEYLNIYKVIWLPYGLVHDDDTNGHIDNIVCWISPTHVMLAWTDSVLEEDMNMYTICREAYNILINSVDACGRKLTVTKLPVPPKMVYTESDLEGLVPRGGLEVRHIGERLAASYINFYIANNAVIMPAFGFDEYDNNAVCV